ncbi:MAG: hypothetical protein PVJ09_01330 [Candidatus Woesebacteria bacterium]|jgi:tetratricopeptide (TPR) repeat protein
MDLSSKQKQAWILREEGEAAKSLAINYGIYYQQETDKDWQSAINTLVDISLSWSVLAKQTGESLYFEAALSSVLQAKKIADFHRLPLRKDFNFHLGRALKNVGQYEQALQALNRFVDEEQDNLTKAELAEAKSQLAFALVKTGKKNEGLKLLHQNVGTLINCPAEISTQGKDLTAIRKAGAQIKLAQVIENKTEAKEILRKVIQETKEKGLGARTAEAEKLLESI